MCLGFNLLGVIGLTDLSNWFMLFLGAFGFAAGYGLMFSIYQAKALSLVPTSDWGLSQQHLLYRYRPRYVWRTDAGRTHYGDSSLGMALPSYGVDLTRDCGRLLG